MVRITSFLYWLAACFIFFFELFVASRLGRSSIADVLQRSPFGFGVRTPFGRWWIKLVARSFDGNTYVMLAGLALILVFWQSRPIVMGAWQGAETGMARILAPVEIDFDPRTDPDLFAGVPKFRTR